MNLKTQVFTGEWPPSYLNFSMKRSLCFASFLIISCSTTLNSYAYSNAKAEKKFTTKSYSAVAETVSGIVTDANGQPLPGVSVTVKGTNNGTQTDVNGKFTLSVPGSNSVLVFSMVGFQRQEIPVGNKKTFNIQLKDTLKDLSEVVVVGYGEQKKATVTGSVAQIQGKELTKSPAPNVANSLEGRLPGLIVNQRSGEPGRDDPSILVRGTATDGNASPLIVIDGVPRSGISRVNPEDIESVSVLKDASAAI